LSHVRPQSTLQSSVRILRAPDSADLIRDPDRSTQQDRDF